LRAQALNGVAALCVSVGGDRQRAAHLGCVAGKDGVEVTIRLLEVLARRGRVRAREVLAAEGVASFHSAVEDLLVTAFDRRDSGHRRKEPLGLHELRDGKFAYGVGLAFGHADATSLRRLSETAEAAGASGMRAAPGRVLLVIGLTQQTSSPFAAAAEALGFIVRADDLRRHVVACAGAPICASANIAARALAPQIAAAAAPHLDGSFKIHISGCAKGCAHPAPAALTVVGTSSGCALIAEGTARDAPFKVVATNGLPDAVVEIARGLKREDDHV
jgi:precorrin-3B synthase